ncbi:FecR domain-containing protein [candidate division CSSED10-310 bacterium]|uniref:FecR domain-containing protein n=1 Tax=candidate division CSSED10-310 bacterium TaxID=2855610 RepID=A0ABV6YVN6_UNCC1
MKRFYKIFFVMIVFASFLVVCPYSMSQEEHIGKITFFMGEIKINKAGTKNWQPVSLDMPLNSGDSLTTGKESRLEIKYTSGSIVRVGENSQYQVFLKDKADEKKSSKIVSDISLGKLWANVRGIFSTSQNLEVRSPTAVMAIRGTVVHFNAAATKTDVYVYQGKADVAAVKGVLDKPPAAMKPVQVQAPTEVQAPQEVAGPKEVTLAEWTSIVAGEMISVTPDGKYSTSSFDVEAIDDEWVKWNKERDKALQ